MILVVLLAFISTIFAAPIPGKSNVIQTAAADKPTNFPPHCDADASWTKTKDVNASSITGLTSCSVCESGYSLASITPDTNYAFCVSKSAVSKANYFPIYAVVNDTIKCLTSRMGPLSQTIYEAKNNCSDITFDTSNTFTLNAPDIDVNGYHLGAFQDRTDNQNTTKAIYQATDSFKWLSGSFSNGQMMFANNELTACVSINNSTSSILIDTANKDKNCLKMGFLTIKN